MRTYNVNVKNARYDRAAKENDIRVLVNLSKNLGGSIVDVTKSAVLAFGISEKEAGTLVQKYW